MKRTTAGDCLVVAVHYFVLVFVPTVVVSHWMITAEDLNDGVMFDVRFLVSLFPMDG